MDGQVESLRQHGETKRGREKQAARVVEQETGEGEHNKSGGAEEVEGVADDVRKVFTEEGRGVLQVCVAHWNSGLAVSFFSIVDFRAPWGCA